MIKFKWVVVCCLFSALTVTFSKIDVFPDQSTKVATNKYTFSSFNQLLVDGRVEIVLRQVKRSKFVMYLQHTIDQNVVVRKVGGQLQILQRDHFGFGDDSPVVVKLQVPMLKQIDIKGDVILSGRNLRVKNMVLVVDNNGVVYLRGDMGVSKIIQAGSGEVNIRWLDSPDLIVTGSNHGHLLLAGHANKLIVSAANDCLLDAANLRAKQVEVKANGNAEVRVQPLYSLRANAAGNSKIGYYKHIRHLKISKQGSATVTQQAW